MLLTELYPKVSAIIYNVTVIIKTLVLLLFIFLFDHPDNGLCLCCFDVSFEHALIKKAIFLKQHP